MDHKKAQHEKPRYDHYIPVRLSQEMVNFIEALAAREHLNRSQALRMVIETAMATNLRTG